MTVFDTFPNPSGYFSFVQVSVISPTTGVHALLPFTWRTNESHRDADAENAALDHYRDEIIRQGQDKRLLGAYVVTSWSVTA